MSVKVDWLESEIRSLEQKVAERDRRIAELLLGLEPFCGRFIDYANLGDSWDSRQRFTIGELRGADIALGRCLVTGNPVGTDTRPKGKPCPCAVCSAATGEKP